LLGGCVLCSFRTLVDRPSERVVLQGTHAQ